MALFTWGALSRTGAVAFGVFLAGAAVVAPFVALFMWWHSYRLSGPLRRISEANGWSFVRTKRKLGKWDGAPFSYGDHCNARNTVRGVVNGHDFVAFDLDVVHGSLYRRETDYYSVVLLKTQVPLPTVELTRTLGGLEHAVGISRLEFENEQFNRRFWVACYDHKHASDVLNARAIESILGGGIVNLRIGDVRGHQIAWATGRLEVREVLGWSRAMAAVADCIPDFVWNANGPVPRDLINP